MRSRALWIGLGISLLISGSMFGQTLGAVLTGSQETPAPCATSGTGNATVTFDSTRQNIAVTITVANLGSPINNFHIHEGAAGVGGPVVINLIGLGGVFVNGTMTGTFPVPDPALVQRMVQNPAGFYVNVHTAQCPGGAIRGQLSYVTGGPVTYAAELRGSKETPPNSSTAFGSALVTFDPVNNTIAWEVNDSGIGANATASHIHRGAAGSAGPVIINFATGPTQLTNGRTSGSGPIAGQQSSSFLASDLTALATASTANGYYVNLHSTAFGAGEIRGQLVPAQEVDIPVAGHATNGIGQTFISDVRIFNPSFDTPTTALVEYFQGSTTANTNATASMAVNLPARGTAVLNDVAGPSGLNVTGIGALRISSVANLVATSRIFVNTSNGSFGQFCPGLSRANALRRGVMPQVSNTSAATGFRANVGFFNPNPSTVTVRVEARNADGTVVGSNVITLQALSQQQNSIGTYFPGVDVSNSPVLSLSFDASSGIFAYVSEVDNSSGDSILIPGQPDSGTATSQ
jgi:hypothetical protein